MNDNPSMPWTEESDDASMPPADKQVPSNNTSSDLGKAKGVMQGAYGSGTAAVLNKLSPNQEYQSKISNK